MTTLKFNKSAYFDLPVDNLPQKLEILIFGNGFDQKIDYLPQNLKYLEFGHNFNKPVTSLNNKQKLETVIFGANFNLVPDSLPVTLKKLEFGSNFNRKINTFPRHLGTVFRLHVRLLFFSSSAPNLQKKKPLLVTNFANLLLFTEILIFNQFSQYSYDIDNLPESLQVVVFGGIVCCGQKLYPKSEFSIVATADTGIHYA